MIPTSVSQALSVIQLVRMSVAVAGSRLALLFLEVCCVSTVFLTTQKQMDTHGSQMVTDLANTLAFPALIPLLLIFLLNTLELHLQAICAASSSTLLLMK